MKYTLICLISFFYAVNVYSQSDYYYYHDKKILLHKVDNKKYILLKPNVDEKEKKKIIKEKKHDNINILKTGNNQGLKNILEYKTKKIQGINWATITSTQKLENISFRLDSNVLYESFFYKSGQGYEAGISHLFYVKLFSDKDYNALHKMANINNVEILGNTKSKPLLFTLACNKSSLGNALEMANVFHESKLFEFSMPDIMYDLDPLCGTDPLFASQWGLLNTGQYGGDYGVDINFCQAKQITLGTSNIILAVIDGGLEKDHPDFANIHPYSYDAVSGATPSQPRHHHGMNCAGIIGAENDNGIGVTGIAPGCSLMDISIDMFGSPGAPLQRAVAIDKAVENGAAVLNLSWKSQYEDRILDDAIRDALENGRDGLGTIVAVAAGNDNKDFVYYPGDIHDDIIVVGNAGNCGNRSSRNSCSPPGHSYSNYGEKLDVMAPGVLCPTLDLQGSLGKNTNPGTDGDYYFFSGTSAACPHVVAIAGLILSEHPNLTQQEVSRIIESTANKTGDHIYEPTPGRPNGDWCKEAGYGLVDAYEALQADVCETAHEVNRTFISNTTINDCYAVFKNVEVDNNAKLTVDTEKGIKIIGEFEVKLGSELEIK